MTRLDVSTNKYRAKRTWSTLCGIFFASKREAEYGDGLFLTQKAGEINELQFHRKFRLCDKPKVVIEVDFCFRDSKDGQWKYQDCKGKETREYRVKRLWLKEKLGIEVQLIR